MRTRVLLFSLFTVTVFAIGILITLLFNTAPSGIDVISLFYVSLFLTIFGLVFMVGYGLSWLRFQSLPSWSSTATAFRLSAWIAVAATIFLLLRSFSLLNLATTIVVIVGLAILELTFRKRITLKQ